MAKNYSLRNIKKRVVKKTDSWCVGPDKGEKKPRGNAPWGHVIEIDVPNKDIDLKNVHGYIIRSKREKNLLLLQVVGRDRKDFPQYRITVVEKKLPIAYGEFKTSVIINIRNMRKPLKRRPDGGIID